MIPFHEPAIRQHIESRVQSIFGGLSNFSHVAPTGSYKLETQIGVDANITVTFNDADENFLVVTVRCNPFRFRYVTKNSSEKWYGWENRTIASFRMSYLDGGQAIVMSHVNLERCLRNRGYGVKLHKLRLDIAQKIHAPSVVATSNSTNHAQRRIFEHFGWTMGVLDASHFIWYKTLNYK